MHEPGTYWAYSTATTQIVSGILAQSVGGGREGVRAFVERELATPLGAKSLLIEFDAAGTPLGGGYVFATARDWARLGTLYLRDGVWDGARVLPEGWVGFARTVAHVANNGVYGAHFWVNGNPGDGQFRPLRQGLEAFEMSGNGGQFVVIAPDRDLVVVRLGEMQRATWAELGDLALGADRGIPAARRGGVALRRRLALGRSWCCCSAARLRLSTRSRPGLGRRGLRGQGGVLLRLRRRAAAWSRAGPTCPRAWIACEVELLPDGVRGFVTGFAERIARYEPGFGCTLH